MVRTDKRGSHTSKAGNKLKTPARSPHVQELQSVGEQAASGEGLLVGFSEASLNLRWETM